MRKRKLLEKALSGAANFRFGDFVALVEAFGFNLDRCEGSHHIFKRPDIGTRLNIQNCNGQAKPYQVRQFLRLVEQNNLTLGDDE
jgi:predicted RNA binding protein YcfA (HicA-like mRNA interferase family)